MQGRGVKPKAEGNTRIESRDEGVTVILTNWKQNLIYLIKNFSKILINIKNVNTKIKNHVIILLSK